MAVLMVSVEPSFTLLVNNRASGVLSLFITGVQNFGIPSRVRCDHGLENTAVALQKRVK